MTIFEDIVDVIWHLTATPSYGNGKFYSDCKFCGKGKLKWKETKKGWRLYQGRKQHKCEQYRRTIPVGPILVHLENTKTTSNFES